MDDGRCIVCNFNYDIKANVATVGEMQKPMIRKISIVLFLFTLFNNVLLGQDYTGIHSSRFFPLQNLSNQPADLIRSDHKWHINVVGAQYSIVNYFLFDETNFLKFLSNIGANDIKYVFGTDQSIWFPHAKVALPSVSYKLNSKHAFAFSSNIRADGLYKSSNNKFGNIFKGIEDPELLDLSHTTTFRHEVHEK